MCPRRGQFELLHSSLAAPVVAVQGYGNADGTYATVSDLVAGEEVLTRGEGLLDEEAIPEDLRPAGLATLGTESSLPP